MSGKIELKVRKGYSKDKRYNYYPEWFLEITDEDDENLTVNISPSWEALKNLIRDIKIHELRVDKTRERKNDADRWEWAMKEAIEEAQTTIKDFEIPEIYTEQELKK